MRVILAGTFVINKESQEFYRKQLRRPVRRFLKAAFPLITAATIVFTIMIVIFYFVPSTRFYSGGKIMIINHSVMAILLSITIVFLARFFLLKRQSKFQPIRIPIKQKAPPFDEN